MKPTLFFVLGSLAMLCGTVSAQEVTILEEPLDWAHAAPTDGATLYNSLCAVCHGSDAKGNGPAAPALKALVPDLTILAAKSNGKFPKKKVISTIEGKTRVAAHGDLDMPIWGHAFSDVRRERKVAERERFARLRIENLAEYLGSIQQDLGN